MRVLLFRHFLGTVNFGISALSLADSQNVNNVPWIKNLLFTGCLENNETPIFLYISVRIKATVLCFIWEEIGGPLVRFAYRNMSER